LRWKCLSGGCGPLGVVSIVVRCWRDPLLAFSQALVLSLAATSLRGGGLPSMRPFGFLPEPLEPPTPFAGQHVVLSFFKAAWEIPFSLSGPGHRFCLLTSCSRLFTFRLKSFGVFLLWLTCPRLLWVSGWVVLFYQRLPGPLSHRAFIPSYVTRHGVHPRLLPDPLFFRTSASAP